MAEIMAAIIGATLGAVFSWYYSRSQPHFIFCREEFQSRLTTDFSQTRITYRDTAVEQLYVLRLRFQNMGDRVIHHPLFLISVKDDVEILGCEVSFDPPRQNPLDTHDLSEVERQTATRAISNVKENEVKVSLDMIYPANTTQESVLIDILTTTGINGLVVRGKGEFEDRTAWGLKFEPWFETRRKINNRVRMFNRLSVIGLSVLTIVLVYIHRADRIITIDTDLLRKLMVDPFFVVLAILLIIFLTYAFIMGLRGWILWIPLPFFSRIVEIRFRRK